MAKHQKKSNDFSDCAKKMFMQILVESESLFFSFSSSGFFDFESTSTLSLSHKHTHTHTLSLNLFLSHTLSRSFSRSIHFLIVSLFHPPTISLSHCNSSSITPCSGDWRGTSTAIEWWVEGRRSVRWCTVSWFFVVCACEGITQPWWLGGRALVW